MAKAYVSGHSSTKYVYKKIDHMTRNGSPARIGINGGAVSVEQFTDNKERYAQQALKGGIAALRLLARYPKK